ncbi:MAG: hypothetical protein AAF950_17340 [Pseudomonadota bacterium]
MFGHIFHRAAEGVDATTLKVDSTDGAFWFDVVVPPGLARVAVLDASAEVNELNRLSDSVQIAPGFVPEEIDYSDLQIITVPSAAGREALEKMAGSKKQGPWKAYMKDVTDYVQALPTDEAVIVWHFTQDKGKPDFKAKVIEAFEDVGIDVEATVTVDGKEKPRFIFTTHGSETGDNDKSYAKHTVFIGVLHRNKLEVVADAKAETGRPEWRPSQEIVNKLWASDVAARIYQGTSRSDVRNSTYGKANSATVFLPIQTPGVLDMLMSRAFKTAPAPIVKASSSRKAKRGPTRTDLATQEILEVVGGLGPGRYSIQGLRKMVRSEWSNHVWKEAVKRFKNNRPDNVSLEGLGIVKG